MERQESGRRLRLLRDHPVREHRNMVVLRSTQSGDDVALAYSESAQRLADTFKGRPIDDLILLPFLALYRQAYELELKNSIRFLATLRIKYVGGDSDHLRRLCSAKYLRETYGHNLAKLVREARHQFDELRLPEPYPSEVEEMVERLHEADRAGTAFRYAGELPAHEEHSHFPNLAARLSESFRALENTSSWAEYCYSETPTLQEVTGADHAFDRPPTRLT